MKKLVFTITTFENLAFVLANLESLKNRADTDLFIVLNDTVDTCGKYNALKASGINFISLDGVLFNEGSCKKKEERLKVSKNKTLAIPIVIKYFIGKEYKNIYYVSDNVCVIKPEWILDKKEEGITLYLKDIEIDENLCDIKRVLSLDVWKVKVTEQTESFLSLVNKNICTVDNSEQLGELLVFYSLLHKEISIIQDDTYIFVSTLVDLGKIQEATTAFNYVDVQKIAQSIERFTDNKANYCFEQYKKKVSDYRKFFSLKFKDSRKLGVNIFGYFEDTMSMALTARNFADKVLLCGVPVSLVNYSYFENKEFEKYRDYYNSGENEFTNIMVSDCQEIIKRNNQYVKNNKPVFALTFWEFETGLEKFFEVTNFVDGFISTSEFCHKVFENTFKGARVAYIPFPFKLDNKKKKPEGESDVDYVINKIPKDKYKLYFNFDLNSSFYRKNPLGILEALKYLKNKEKIYVIIKINGSNNKEESIKDILKKVDELGLSKSVLVIEGFISDDDMQRLLGVCNAYISLHRGEGVGLGMIEAMANDVPVIATNYSGNTQFCTTETSILVDYKLVECTDKLETYSQVRLWAEPDYKDAARKIDSLIDEKSEDMIKAARRKIFELYNDGKFEDCLYDFLVTLEDPVSINFDERLLSIRPSKDIRRVGYTDMKKKWKCIKYRIVLFCCPIKKIRQKYKQKLETL